MARGEVGAKFAQVIPLGAEVVVDDVEKGGEARAVRRIDQPREPGRSAIVGVRGERRDAVVAPVARPGEGRDRHHLDGAVSSLGHLGHESRGAVGRALRRESAEVDLAEDQFLQRYARAAAAGRDRREIHHLARPMHAVGLRGRAGVGQGRATVEREGVGPRGGVGGPPPALAPIHRHAFVADTEIAP